MQSLQNIRSKFIPLRIENVDTDQIIPARFLKATTKDGFGKNLFRDWRYENDDETKPKVDFVLNQAQYSGAILVAAKNFGCGSSREHAVWALQNYGFKVVLSSRFADIFRGNSQKMGLLTVILPQDEIEKIWKKVESAPDTKITVDLEAKTVSYDTTSTSFSIDDYTRWRLMEGLDDIGLTFTKIDEVAKFEEKRVSFKPKTLPIK